MAATREINFGLPPPPGMRKEQIYYDNPRQALFDQRNQFYNNNAGSSQQLQREPNAPQRRVTFSASTDGEREGSGGRQQQQLDDPPSYPHTSYSPNRILGLGARSAANSPVFYYTRHGGPGAAGVSQGSSPYYSLYSYTSSPYYSSHGTSRYTTSSTATASNLPGPGRNLGRLYSFFGKQLEALMSFIAVSLGFGPDATALRLEFAIKQAAEAEVMKMKMVRTPPSPKTLEKRRRKLNKLCVRLLEYTDAREFTTQFNALTRLLNIAYIPEVPDCNIAWDTLANVHALEWMQTLKRSIQRRRAFYAPKEFEQLCMLHADMTRALEACARAARVGIR